MKPILLLIIASLLLCCQSSVPIQTDPPIPAPTTEIVEEVPPLQQLLPCPDDMVFIERLGYCIDRYEAPNQKGVFPFYAQTAYQGVAYCQSIGKDLCTQEQWNEACIGPEHKTYPYGNVYHRGICNDDKMGWVKVPWLEMNTPAWDQWCKENYKGEPSGNREGCVSDDGVFDLMGNTSEWVREPKSQYGYVVKGDYWYGAYSKGSIPACKNVNGAHDPKFNSYEMNFRCCKSAY